ncbi:hypothetical protein ACFQ7B_11535 [Streptomyces erythrochromogenes]|uniref:hypothetical protein n=1 Tax=Streptomyces erythrochromogenes TaxID=285574 RepID=UPI0036B13620
MSRHRIWLGDTLRALELADGPEERAHVLRLLGFESGDPADTGPPEAEPAVPAGLAEQEPAAPEPPVPVPAPEAVPEVRLSELPLLHPVRFERLSTGSQPDPFPRYDPGAARPLAHQPILDPLTSRRTLRRLTAVRSADGPPDLRALVNVVAQGRAVLRWPTLRVPTSRHGVQVLVDQGLGMQPFRRDQMHMVQRAREVLGPHLTEILFFADDPLHGVVEPDGDVGPYRPPAAGGIVLVLSDLGLGGPPEPRTTARDWTSFAELVADSGSHVATLTPYPPDRRPAWTAVLNPLTWDDAHDSRSDDVHDLAVLLSLATRIEPELIRAIRRELLPGLGAVAEADLWFSSWIAARSPGVIAFSPEVLPMLREFLDRDPDAAHRARRIISELHRDISPALFLEEQLTWHSLFGSRQAAETQLDTVLHALVDERRTGLAGWFGEAWQRLPEQARRLNAAWRMANTVRRHVPALDPGVPDELSVEDVSLIAAEVGETLLGLHRKNSDLLIGAVSGEGAVAVKVPDTLPVPLEVTSENGSSTLLIDPGATVRAPVGTGPVSVMTGSGAVYTLPQGPGSADPGSAYGPHEAEAPYPALHACDGVVFVPGIGGSELTEIATGRKVWGFDMRSLLNFFRRLDVTEAELAEPGSRLQATHLVHSASMIPGLLGIEDGAGLRRMLRNLVAHRAAYAEFPYDWRMSVAHNSGLLEEAARAHLERWIAHPANPAPERSRLVFVAVNTGGLLVKGLGRGREGLLGRTNAVVTLGTPFYGTVKSIGLISDHSALLQRSAGFARTAPGVYDMLPRYRCIDRGAELERLTVEDIEAVGGDPRLAAAALAYQEALASVELPGHFRVVGIGQQTPVTMILPPDGSRSPRLTYGFSVNGSEGPFDGRVEPGGDGTVPFFSADPDRSGSFRVYQQHSALPGDRTVQAAILDHLTRRPITDFL